MHYRQHTTRQSLKVDPRGPALSNLLHPYVLLPRTDLARVTKQKMVIKQAARAQISTRTCEFGAFFVAHLSEGVLGRSGEARAPEVEKSDFEIDEVPNLLHPLIYFIRGLLATTGGYPMLVNN